MTIDLPTFLLARIADDHEVAETALAAVDADRTEYAAMLHRRTGQLSTVTAASHCGQDMGPRGTVEALPGRVLAECEAKRRLVAYITTEVAQTVRLVDLDLGRSIDDDNRLLELLALPYADHPDYDPAWRP